MTKTAVSRIFTATSTLSALLALLPGAARAHDIAAMHVHQSHIAQGLGLAVLVAVVLGVAFLVRRSRRR